MSWEQILSPSEKLHLTPNLDMMWWDSVPAPISGITYWKHHKTSLSYIETLLESPKKMVFVLSTGGGRGTKDHARLKERLAPRGLVCIGDFSCRGILSDQCIYLGESIRDSPMMKTWPKDGYLCGTSGRFGEGGIVYDACTPPHFVG